MYNDAFNAPFNPPRRDWMNTVLQPTTYHNTNHASDHSDLFSLSTPTSDFATFGYEPASAFNYEAAFRDVAANTYGRPCTPELDLQLRRAPSDDNLPAALHVDLPDRDTDTHRSPSAPTQQPAPVKKRRGRPPKTGRVDKENTSQKAPTKDKKNSNGKPGKQGKPANQYPPPACEALTKVVWEVEPFAAPHGEVTKRWEAVLSKLQHLDHFKTMKVPAIRTFMERLLEWHHDPDSSDAGRQLDEVLKGTSAAISIGGLLDNISEAKQQAAGRTEEQKAKVAQKEDYDKRGGEAIRLNSLRSMRRPGSPAGPTSPRHYVPPKKEVINIDSSVDSDASGTTSPYRGSSPEVEELPPPAKGRKRSAPASFSRGDARRAGTATSGSDVP
ncbi:hypothetical protein DFH06DRAFT_1153681 [Mycena polygramma]|nr:hypothetical protein DFH06DRAFT_1153681 [Mycena polygramma]